MPVSRHTVPLLTIKNSGDFFGDFPPESRNSMRTFFLEIPAFFLIFSLFLDFGFRQFKKVLIKNLVQ
jgi:hypothetical protein